MPDKLAPYLAALNENGVRHVDGAGLMSAERPEHAIPLFPRGGTHWNSVGGALALQEATRALPCRADRPIGLRLGARARSASAPIAICSICSIFCGRTRIIRPRRSAGRREGGDCAHTPRLLAMGGSFVRQVLAAATLAPCPPQIDYWFYMRTEDNSVELGHYRRAPGDTSNGERRSAAFERAR